MIKKGLNLRPQDMIIPFSAVTKQGKEEIWSVLDKVVEDFEQGEEI